MRVGRDPPTLQLPAMDGRVGMAALSTKAEGTPIDFKAVYTGLEVSERTLHPCLVGWLQLDKWPDVLGSMFPS